MGFCNSYPFRICDVCSADSRSVMARFDHRDRIATFFEELADLL